MFSIYSHFTLEGNHIHTSFPILEFPVNLLPNSTPELFKVSLLNIENLSHNEAP